MNLISPNDVIRTSAYIPLDFDSSDENKPNYEQFTKIVAMSVDSVERGKYGYQYFYKTLEILKRNYNIPYPSQEIAFEATENIDYESFSKLVSKVVTDNREKKNFEEVFNIVNNLMDEYDISRYEAPSHLKYGGTPLKKDLIK